MKVILTKKSWPKTKTLIDYWDLRNAIIINILSNDNVHTLFKERVQSPLIKTQLTQILIYEVSGWERSSKPSFAETKQLISFLIDIGISINALNIEDQTLLKIACRQQNIDLVEFLISIGADINEVDEEGNPLLLQLLKDGVNSEFLQKLLNIQSLDIHKKGASGYTSLIVAVKHHIHMIEPLIAKGALLEEKTNEGLTALAIAVCCCTLDVMKTLLSAGANPEVIDNSGATLMSLAIGCGESEEDVDCIRYLVEKNIAGAFSAINGVPVLNYAILKKCADETLELLARPEHINQQCRNTGDTALMIVCRQDGADNPQLVTMLMKYLANPMLVNDRGETVFSILDSYHGLDDEETNEDIERVKNKIAFASHKTLQTAFKKPNGEDHTQALKLESILLALKPLRKITNFF